MRRLRSNLLASSLLAFALLCASSQYLAHFHIPQANAAYAGHGDDAAPHGESGHCTLCLQFERLPAPPAALELPVALFYFIALAETERLERLALQSPRLWPSPRAPPV